MITQLRTQRRLALEGSSYHARSRSILFSNSGSKGHPVIARSSSRVRFGLWEMSHRGWDCLSKSCGRETITAERYCRKQTEQKKYADFSLTLTF